MKCKTKIEKSLAVITIVDEIRSLSPDAGFVKYSRAPTTATLRWEIVRLGRRLVTLFESWSTRAEATKGIVLQSGKRARRR